MSSITSLFGGWFVLGIAIFAMLCCEGSNVSFAAESDATNQADVEPSMDDGDEIRGEESILTFSLVMAVTLAITHLCTPLFLRLLIRNEAKLGSFGGGMGVAYVFVHLLVELEKGDTLLGSRVQLVVLAGFLAYYGVEHLLTRDRDRKSQEPEGFEFGVELLISWVYSWLLIYSMPESIREFGWHILPIMIAMVIHLLYSDSHLCREFPERWMSRGRFILATAPVVSWLTCLVFPADDPVFSNLIIAFIAGQIMYKLFSRELPEASESSYSYFLGGSITFVTLDLIAELT